MNEWRCEGDLGLVFHGRLNWGHEAYQAGMDEIGEVAIRDIRYR